MAFTKIAAAGIDTSGTITTQSISVSGVSTVGSLSIGATSVISSARQLQNIASLDATTTATIESAVANAPNTFTDLSVSGISTLGVTSATNLTAQSLNVSGIITATQLSTGASGTGVNISTDTISGPATLTIDPAAVGDNTGAVRIKGDLYVDGTQFIVNSTTIELADFNVGIATTVGTNALLDGAGIGIGSASNQKTLTWSNGSTALKSSEDFDVASGKVYKIAGTSVLSNNTLGSGILTSSLTSVGTLGSLSVTGSIELGHASDTSLTRVSAGVVAIEGVNIVTTSSTDTLTNKTLTSPTLQTPILGTPQSGTLTSCGGLPISGLTASTSTALGVGSIELGHASDTTLARVSAGVVSIEGVNIVTISSTDTLTNKTLTSPTLTTPVLGAATATSVNASGIITANSYDIGTAAGISTTITGITTTDATAIDSFSTSTYRSSKIQIQITQGTDYQASDVLLIHNGTTANIIEYGSIATNDYLGNFSADISGANARLLVTMSSASSSTVKVLSQRITI